MEKKRYRNMSIRVDVELYQQIQCIAQAENRTVSRQAYYWLRRAVWSYLQENSLPPGED